MAELRTEEEQIEALKHWWLQYGKSLLMALAIGLIGVLGWQYYQGQQLQASQQASAYYQRMIDNANSLDLTDPVINNIKQDAYTLKTQYGDTVYASYASLVLARLAMLQADYEQAEEELLWVLTNTSSDTGLHPLAHIRLASVLYQQGQYEQALARLNNLDTGEEWSGLSQTLKGDILAAQGADAQARTAYDQAIQAYQQQGVDVSALQLKLANLSITD